MMIKRCELRFMTGLKLQKMTRYIRSNQLGESWVLFMFVKRLRLLSLSELVGLNNWYGDCSSSLYDFRPMMIKERNHDHSQPIIRCYSFSR